MAETTSTVDKRAIAERLERVEERIQQACQRAGRRRREITLIGVTKTFPLAVVQAGYEAGLRHFGENRAGELVEKAEQTPGVRSGGDLFWHMVGHLQRNKAKDIAEHADVFQALDSPRLAKELDKRAGRTGRPMPCLVQINITRQERKYGIMPEKAHAFLDSLAAHEHLDVGGLMAMATYTDDTEVIRREFRAMRKLFDTYDADGNPQVAMNHLSMGMSEDFEVAVEEGATQLRLGRAIFGARD